VPCSLEVRGAAHDLLHEVVDEGLWQLRAALAHEGFGLPRHVNREFEGFLACGDPKRGFAWLQCHGCDHHRLVPFSCKTRGFCSSCGGRRMNETAARWVDSVIPHAATRQWVLTVPWKRRWLLARRPKLAGGVLRVALDVVERWYRRRAGAPLGRGGSVTAIQRFGSDLRLNLHFHVVALDGVYVRGADGRLSFRRVVPHTVDIERLVLEIAEGCEAWLERQGFGADAEVDPEEDDSLSLLQQASVGGYVAVGARARRQVRRVRRVQTLGGRQVALPARTASCDGYNLNAGVSVKGGDREGLERLCRYLLRPPLSKERLERKPDGTVVIGLKKAWSDGTTAIELSPSELVERLSAIIPPPRANTIIYRGVLAGNSAWRKEVIPKPPADRRVARAAVKLARGSRINEASQRVPWVELLKRVFKKDGYECGWCGGRMVLRCVVVGQAAGRILAGLERATGPP